MSTAFSEYREVRSTESLRQGDVLEAVDAKASMWNRHLFVITADCDFAHHQNQARVTCIPLLTADEYLLEMRVPRLRDRFARKMLKDLRAILNRSGGLMCPMMIAFEVGHLRPIRT